MHRTKLFGLIALFASLSAVACKGDKATGPGPSSTYPKPTGPVDSTVTRPQVPVGGPFSLRGTANVLPNAETFTASGDRFVITAGNSAATYIYGTDASGNPTLTRPSEAFTVTSTGNNVASSLCSDNRRYARRRGLNLVDEIDPTTGQVLTTFNQQGQMPLMFVTSIRYSPDCRSMIVADSNRKVYVLDLSNRANVTVRAYGDTASKSGAATLAAFSPDNRHIALAGQTAGANGTNVIQYYSAGGGMFPPYFPASAHRNGVTGMEWGRWLISAGKDSTVKVWDTNLLSAQPARVQQVCSKALLSVPSAVMASVNTGNFGVGLSNGYIAIYDVAGAQNICSSLWTSENKVHNGPVIGLMTSPDLKFYISVGSDGKASFIQRNNQ